MKCLICARVSSAEQADGYSLSAQQKLLREYAKQKGFEIHREFTIAETASKEKQRKVFQEMLATSQKEGISVLIFEKVDRVTRNLRHSLDIYDWLEGDEDRQLHCVKDAIVLHRESKSQVKLNWDLKVVIAKNFADNLSEEVKKGTREKARQGHCPYRPPLGYKSVEVNGRKVHVQDEQMAPMIKKLLVMYATGNYSISQLVEFAYQGGIRSRNGKKVSKSRIADILSNPYYYGHFRFIGEVWPGKHEPLISKDVYDRIQDILAGKTAPKVRKHNYTFKGLVRCAECGRTISWEKHKGHVYGHCKNYKDCSQRSTSREDTSEQQMLSAFGDLELGNKRLVDWVRKALKEDHQEQADYHQATLSELQERIKKLNNRLDQIYDDKLDEVITVETYNRKRAEYMGELEQVNDQMDAHQKAQLKYQDMGIKLYDLSQNALKIYRSKDTEEKRQLINIVFSELTMVDGKLVFKYSKPFEVLHNAVMATKSSKLIKNLPKSDQILEPKEIVTVQSLKGGLAASRSEIYTR